MCVFQKVYISHYEYDRAYLKRQGRFESLYLDNRLRYQDETKNNFDSFFSLSSSYLSTSSV